MDAPFSVKFKVSLQNKYSLVTAKKYQKVLEQDMTRDINKKRMLICLMCPYYGQKNHLKRGKDFETNSSFFYKLWTKCCSN